MALYTTESIERLKDAIDMVDLVSSRTELKRLGAQHKGLCPFHDERTPSFSVNSTKGVYYCFGCNASGDAIRFVQETEALDFGQAVEMLADRYRVELQREEEDPRAEQRRRRRDRLAALVERAAGYYERYLWEAEEATRARAYLSERGLEEEILRGFRIGFAPQAPDRISLAAQRGGYSVEEIVAAGLGKRGRSGFHDAFRGRIMFPLADGRGRVLGFGARAMRSEQGPKYLNTSENELYHKGRQLFGIDRARAAAAKAGRVVVVEGYTDVLALHQAGVAESVAIMGTSLTQEQLAELARVAQAIFLALDADSAGQEAMLRAARAANSKEVELRVVELPGGSDPADLVAQEGADGFRARLAAARSVPDFAARRVLGTADLGTAHGRDRALEEVMPFVRSLSANPATRDELVSFVADRLDVPASYLMTQLANQAAPPARSESPGRRGGGAVGRVDQPIDATLRTERSTLALCLGEGSEGRMYLGRLTDEHFSSEVFRSARRWLAEHFDDPVAGLPEDDPMLAAAVTQIVMLAEEERSSAELLDVAFLQLEVRRVDRSLRDAERQADRERQRALWGERELVRQKLDEAMGATA